MGPLVRALGQHRPTFVPHGTRGISSQSQVLAPARAPAELQLGRLRLKERGAQQPRGGAKAPP